MMLIYLIIIINTKCHNYIIINNKKILSKNLL